MIIACPSCSSAFEVPPDQIGEKGRKVRCKLCRHVWFQQPLSSDDATPKQSLDQHEATADSVLATQAPPQDDETTDALEAAPSLAPELRATSDGSKGALRKGPGQRGGKAGTRPSLASAMWRWGIFLATITLVGGGLVVARTPLINFWPSSHHFYALIGLPRLPIEEALRRQGFEVHMDIDNGIPRPKLKGRIVNVSDETRSIPFLRLTYYNDPECHAPSCVVSTEEIALASSSPKGNSAGSSLKGLELPPGKAYEFIQPLPGPLPKGTAMVTAGFVS